MLAKRKPDVARIDPVEVDHLFERRPERFCVMVAQGRQISIRRKLRRGDPRNEKVWDTNNLTQVAAILFIIGRTKSTAGGRANCACERFLNRQLQTDDGVGFGKKTVVLGV